MESSNFLNLETLSLSENNIFDISILEKLQFSFKVRSTSNRISDISPLTKTNFKILTKLFLFDNKISDISMIDNFKFPKLIIFSLY